MGFTMLTAAVVRGRGGQAGESRQALIGATVACPGLPRLPGDTSTPPAVAQRNPQARRHS